MAVACGAPWRMLDAWLSVSPGLTMIRGDSSAIPLDKPSARVIRTRNYPYDEPLNPLAARDIMPLLWPRRF